MLGSLKKIVPSSLRDKLRSSLVALGDVNEVELVYRLYDKLEKSPRTMLDVGSHRGSSCQKFAEAGWHVHAFEPDPQNFEKLKESVGHFPNVDLNRSAVVEIDCKEVQFFRSSENTYIGSLSAFDQSHTETVRVPGVSLDTVCREKNIKKVDFLKIDAEGHDLFVLKSFPWGRMKPGIVVCEFEDKKTKPLGYDFADLVELLRKQNYQIIVSEWFPITSYAGPFFWRRFSNELDANLEAEANGNIIAIQDASLFAAMEKICRRKTNQVRRSKQLRALIS